MATFDLRNRVGKTYPHDTTVLTAGAQRKLSKIFNAKQAAAVKGSDLTTADIVQFFEIPAKALIQSVMINVTTAEGAACTIDVGDSGSANRYMNDLDVNATGMTVYSTVYSVGDSNIDFRVTTNTAATNNFIAEITVCYLEMSCQAT